MPWLYHEDAWWEPEDTGPSAGRVLYWLATALAVLILVFAIADFFIGWAQGHPILHIMGFVAALAVWLIGLFCRSLSNG